MQVNLIRFYSTYYILLLFISSFFKSYYMDKISIFVLNNKYYEYFSKQKLENNSSGLHR